MKQFRKELHRYRWIVLIALVLGLTLRWWSKHDQAERLMDMPGSYDWIIKQNQLYWIGSGEHGPTFILYSIPVTGGERHAYGADPGSWRIAHIVGCSAEGIYYTAEEEPQGYRRAAPRPKSAFMPPSTLGHPQTAPSGFTNSSPTPASQKPVYLHFLNFSGDPVREITSVATVSHLSVALAGDTIYWTCSHPTFTRVANHITSVDRSEIAYQSVHNGAVRQISARKDDYTALYPGKNGVYCARRPDPDKPHLELVYMQAGHPETMTLPQYDSWDPPVEWKDRIYWTKAHSEAGAPLPVQLNNNTIVSAKTDGSDFRIECRLPVNENITLSQPSLVLHQDKMYLVMTEHPVRSEGDEYQTLLYRVHFDRAKKLEPVCSLRRKGIGNGLFDGPYFYYTVLEDRTNLLDNVADRYPGGKFAQVLFRYQLPD